MTFFDFPSPNDEKKFDQLCYMLNDTQNILALILLANLLYLMLVI